MRYANLLGVALILVPVFVAAAPNDILIPSVVPLNQHLATVAYLKDGRQSGCGFRITGETRDDLWLNVLITVFIKETGATFGVVKIVAIKVAMQDGKPRLEDGRLAYLGIGNIQSAWIKPDSAELPIHYQSGGPLHSDAYMATTEFASTMDLLVAISRESFKVGLNRGGGKNDEIYQFDKGVAEEDAGRLSLCMKNLRAEIEENRNRKAL